MEAITDDPMCFDAPLCLCAFGGNGRFGDFFWRHARFDGNVAETLRLLCLDSALLDQFQNGLQCYHGLEACGCFTQEIAIGHG